MSSKKPDRDNLRCNVDAAATIFKDYGDFIKKIIRSQTQDEHQVEDLFQIFFLSLVSNPLPRGIRNTEAYLYKAILNDIADATRSAKKCQNYIQEYVERCNHTHGEETPERAIIEMEEANKLFELIQKQLPHTEARAICLQYRDGLSAKKIAEEMTVRSSTVRGYVSEGLNRIRELLRESQIER